MGVVSLIATSVKLSSSTSAARAGKLPECSTSVLILLFVAFNSVVSSIATSVKLSSSTSSSTAGKLLEFSLPEKIRTGSVGNVLDYWLTEKTIGESPNQRRNNCVNALCCMVAKLKSTTQFFNSVFGNLSAAR